jgi:hypothetical protein
MAYLSERAAGGGQQPDELCNAQISDALSELARDPEGHLFNHLELAADRAAALCGLLILLQPEPPYAPWQTTDAPPVNEDQIRRFVSGELSEPVFTDVLSSIRCYPEWFAKLKVEVENRSPPKPD